MKTKISQGLIRQACSMLGEPNDANDLSDFFEFDDEEEMIHKGRHTADGEVAMLDAIGY